MLTIEIKIREYLEDLKENSLKRDKGLYVIMYDGVKLVMGSTGKSSWGSVAAAKNALRFHMPSFYQEASWRDRLKIINKLESEGLIQYVKI